MGKERSGDTYITRLGEVINTPAYTDNPYQGDYILKYHSVENDGWSFTRRGAQEKLHLRISNDANLNDISSLLKEDNVKDNPLIKEVLENMLAEAQINHYTVISVPSSEPISREKWDEIFSGLKK